MLIDIDEIKTKEDLIQVIKIIAKRLTLSKNTIKNTIETNWGENNYLIQPTQPALTKEQTLGIDCKNKEGNNEIPEEENEEW